MRPNVGLLKDRAFDILVIGAGMQGAWVALRAAAAGHRVALLERDDFGAATSSNSLNIVHGGLRYLQHVDFARMRSSILARREFARSFPHLVQPLPCVMPLKSAGIRSPWILGPALVMNDVISGDRNRGVPETARLPHGRLLSARACRSYLAPLVDATPTAGALWWDALSLDSARINLETVLAAARAGAVVANRVKAVRYLVDGNAVRGVIARDRLTNADVEVRASVVLNVTGPWAGEIAHASDLPAAYLPERWIGGFNVVFRRSFGLEAAVALSSMSRAADGSSVLRRPTRELFFVPWLGAMAVGTEYLPLATATDGGNGPPLSAVDEFVAEIARIAPRTGVTMDDVAAVQWGVLPACGDAVPMPIKSPILAAGRTEAGVDGLVVLIGEKLTSAPILSRKVLARAEIELTRAGRQPRVRTSQARGVDMAGNGKAGRIREPEVPHRLSARYGRRAQEIVARYAGRPGLFEPLHAGTDVLAVEVVHAIRGEMAIDLNDIVLRRLGLGGTGHPGLETLRRCAEVAAQELGWSETEAAQAVTGLGRQFARYRDTSVPHRSGV